MWNDINSLLYLFSNCALFSLCLHSLSAVCMYVLRSINFINLIFLSQKWCYHSMFFFFSFLILSFLFLCTFLWALKLTFFPSLLPHLPTSFASQYFCIFFSIVFYIIFITLNLNHSASQRVSLQTMSGKSKTRRREESKKECQTQNENVKNWRNIIKMKTNKRWKQNEESQE